MALAVTERRVPPELVLARMKWAILRHGLRNGDRAVWTYLAVATGTLGAVATWWAALTDPNLLSIALGCWLLGWLVGPLVTTGSDPMRPEYFRACGCPAGAWPVV